MSFTKYILGTGLGLLMLAPLPHAGAAQLAPMLQRPALAVSHPERSVLLSIARAGERLVAAGERGVIIYSDDDGKSWAQARTPVSVTLVALAFPDEKNGWAVGHSGVVLHSQDGGATWLLQLDGNRASRLVLESAQALSSPLAAELEKLGQLFVQDGPDKPFLDVVFTDSKQGWIVGAYGLIFRTRDGGKSWQPWLDRVDNPGGMHLYALRYDPASGGQRIYLAGEQGYFARSDDGGRHFQSIETPYEGSYFDLAALSDGTLMLAGLRGNLWRSTNRGEGFEQIPVGAPVSWNTMKPLPGGDVVLLNQAGGVFLFSSADRTAKPLSKQFPLPLTGLARASDDSYVAVGLGGVDYIKNIGAHELQSSTPKAVTP